MISMSPAQSCPRGNQRERNMGTIIEFPGDAASRRPALDGASCDGLATVLILPVIRIERPTDESGGRGPEEGAAPGRRRRRRP
jgi:hypothetical protein